MGRLIDDDVLLTRIRLNYNNHQNISACDMKDIINTTPTAYNVEKVVAELKETSKQYCEEYKQREGSLYLQDAIEIVRKGGVK